MRNATNLKLDPEWPVSLQQTLAQAGARSPRRLSLHLDAQTTVEARRAQEILRARARRRQYFSARIFSDPAWDILLELYISELAQWKIMISTIGVEANIPQTTVYRWIDILQKERLVERMGDPLNRKRVYVRLTSDGFEAMSAYFEMPE